jgi:hypothetical protein
MESTSDTKATERNTDYYLVGTENGVAVCVDGIEFFLGDRCDFMENFVFGSAQGNLVLRGWMNGCKFYLLDLFDHEVARDHHVYEFHLPHSGLSDKPIYAEKVVTIFEFLAAGHGIPAEPGHK